MLNFSPAAQVRPAMGRTVARSLGETVPPPAPDPLFTGYTGAAGFAETLAVLAVLGAASWVGIRAGMTSQNPYVSGAGWLGGVGAAVMGLLYVGGKSGYAPSWLPAVRVTPS